MIDVNSVEDGNVINSNGMLRAATQDQKILAGAQLNDDDDQADTLESLKSAENISGKKIGQVEFGEKNYGKTGNTMGNLDETDSSPSRQVHWWW